MEVLIQQHNKLSNIPLEWINTMGINTNVGIIDSGCDINHYAIKSCIREYKVFAGEKYKAHGTHVAGIIASCGNEFCYNGFANKTNIYMASIDIGGMSTYGVLFHALSWIKEYNIDVLNLSLCYRLHNTDIEKIIKDIVNNGTIVCCAYSNYYSYPHSIEGVISVGNNENDKADVIAVDNFVSCVNGGKYELKYGSSMATAFMSSICLLAKSFDKKITKQDILNNILGDKKFEPTIFENSIYKQFNKGQIILK